MMIGILQRSSGQTLANLPLEWWMHIQRIAQIGRDGHAGMRDGLHQSALAIAKPGPGGTVQARQLYIIEGQRLVLPVPAPTGSQQLEQDLMCLHIVGIRFSLIPNHPLNGITL